MMIRVTIETATPLRGDAAAEAGGPSRRFEGWMELLGVLAELVGTEDPADRPGRDGFPLEPAGDPPP